MEHESADQAVTGRRNLLRAAGVFGAAGAALVAGTPSAEAAGLTAVTAYSVKDYGAVGNGTTNDRNAIQSAMDAAGATGGTVFFPPGDYGVGGPLFPRSNTIIQGSHTPRWSESTNPDSATKIKMLSGFTGTTAAGKAADGLLMPTGGTYGVRLQNIALVGNLVGTNLHGLRLPDQADYTFNESWILDGVSIVGFTGNGIYGRAQTTQITNSMISNNVGWGINPGDGNRWNDCHVSNCFLYYNRQGNLGFGGSQTSALIMFVNCRFERAGTRPGNLTSPYNAAAPGVRLSNARQIYFTNCSTDANTGNGFEIVNDGTSNYLPNFISLSNCHMSRDGTGNTATLGNYAGVKVLGSATTDSSRRPGKIRLSNCTISSGQADDNGGSGVVGPKYGMWFEQTIDFEFIGGSISTNTYGNQYYVGSNGNVRPEIQDGELGLNTLPVVQPLAGSGIPDGSTYVDQTNNRLYVRVNGAWRYCALTV